MAWCMKIMNDEEIKDWLSLWFYKIKFWNFKEKFNGKRTFELDLLYLLLHMVICTLHIQLTLNHQLWYLKTPMILNLTITWDYDQL